MRRLRPAGRGKPSPPSLTQMSGICNGKRSGFAGWGFGRCQGREMGAAHAGFRERLFFVYQCGMDSYTVDYDTRTGDNIMKSFSAILLAALLTALRLFAPPEAAVTPALSLQDSVL